MKFFHFPILAFAALMFGSCCDTIVDPYKEGVPAAPTGQKVLLIDYSGYRCGNCPEGSAEAVRLKNLFQNDLIIVTMHCGTQFAKPEPSKGFIEDFRTTTGEGLYDFLAISSQPTGSVNFAKVDGSYTMPYTSWATAVSKELRKTPPMTISLTPVFSADSVLTVRADIKYKKASTGNDRIAVYLIEDSIIYQQIDYSLLPNDDLVPNYLHRHVFRGAMSGGKFDGKYSPPTKSTIGAFGEPLPATVANASTSKTYSISFKGTNWNPKNCSVIVSVNDKVTNNTLQVEETHVLE